MLFDFKYGRSTSGYAEKKRKMRKVMERGKGGLTRRRD